VSKILAEFEKKQKLEKELKRQEAQGAVLVRGQGIPTTPGTKILENSVQTAH